MSTPTSQRNTLKFDHVRGKRYGEIFVITHDASGISGAVYNSAGLNDLPQTQWQALNTDQLKQEFNADAVVLNGPRLWAMDSLSVEVLNTGHITAFGGIQMRLVGILRIPDPSMLAASRTPYTEHTIARDTTYEFAAGQPVYELVSPDGHVYVMQASSQIVDPTLTADQLATLASRLQVPAGWQYRARTLTQALVLHAAGVAHILQDELQNTYQRVD
jgi:hypothetical protein